MSLQGINWLAVIVSAVLYVGIGALWYSPLLFGNLWMRLMGITAQDVQSQSAIIYIVPAVVALITAVVLAMIIRATGATALVSGALTGGLMWLGFGATSTLSYTFFKGPPMRVWALYQGYVLVSYLVMGALIGVWA